MKSSNSRLKRYFATLLCDLSFSLLFWCEPWYVHDSSVLSKNNNLVGQQRVVLNQNAMKNVPIRVQITMFEIQTVEADILPNRMFFILPTTNSLFLLSFSIHLFYYLLT